MLPSEIPKLPTDPLFFLVFGNFPSFKSPSPGWVSVPNSFVSFFIFYILSYLLLKASLVAQRLKRLPPMQETPVRSMGSIPGSDPWVRSLGQEYPLEKEMATHSSILAWRIP